MNQQFFIDKQSPEFKIIHESTKWKEHNFVPSFKNTDKVLMEAALKTYCE